MEILSPAAEPNANANVTKPVFKPEEAVDKDTVSKLKVPGMPKDLEQPKKKKQHKKQKKGYGSTNARIKIYLFVSLCR